MFILYVKESVRNKSVARVCVLDWIGRILVDYQDTHNRLRSVLAFSTIPRCFCLLVEFMKLHVSLDLFLCFLCASVCGSLSN